MKPIVLTFVRRYLPGYKSGGPVRTIANMVEQLKEHLEFRIVTLDRDARDTRPYDRIEVHSWNVVGDAHVYYVPESEMHLGKVVQLLRETRHDVLYLNSFFDPRFTGLPLLARRTRAAGGPPVVLAPRGEFSDGALALKSWKKAPYIVAARIVGLYRNLTWQASSAFEAADIRRAFGAQARSVEIAPNLPPKSSQDATAPSRTRESGAPLRVLFVSRITPKKNLEFALRVLAAVSVPVEFSIVGPVADEKYWRSCEDLIGDLPAHVRVSVLGSAEPQSVPALMADHDLFFLPTRGENYGHVIAEALSVGTPVLIADTTPWRELEQARVGWDLALGAELPFVRAIECAAARAGPDYASWRKRVTEYAHDRLTDPSAIDANRRLFLDVCGRTADAKAIEWNASER